ncbi:MAG: Crp/Fnr family transcriptional regulator [Alphaproteobacteria bacterium]|nr:Crp/Fnr family transcriptional regulator [Alphaproteobacteria bacterium]
MTQPIVNSSLVTGSHRPWSSSYTRPAIHALDQLAFFADFPHAAKVELLCVAHLKQIQRGEQLFRTGDAMTHIFWMCTGAVRLYRETPDGHELTDSFLTHGDVLFDPDAIRHRRNHVMTAKALQNSTLLAVPLDWMTEHIKRWDHLADKFFHLLAARAQEARLETEHQATMNAAQIIACFLQKKCVKHGFDPNGFLLPYTKSLIASRLGMELESFSRTLPKLRQIGITIKGKQVAFTNLEAVQDYSCGHCSAADECPTHARMKSFVRPQIKREGRA